MLLLTIFVILLHITLIQCRATRKTLIIGLDGTKSTVFQSALNTNLLPNINRLLSDYSGQIAVCHEIDDTTCATAHSGNRYGSRYPYTYNSSDYLWVTGPGWASVLTGVDNHKHRVKDNNIDSMELFTCTSQQYHTLLYTAKHSGYSTACSGSPAVLSSIEPYSGDGIIDYECSDKFDRTQQYNTCNLSFRQPQSEDNDARDISMTQYILEHITGVDTDTQIYNEHIRSDILFAHYDKIDAAGHQCNFSHNTCYYKAMNTVDTLVGKLIDSIEYVSKQYNEQWLIVLTSDHGGHTADEAHGVTGWPGHDKVLLHDEIVPFIVSIIDVNKDHNLKLKPLKQPVKHYDVAPTVLKWMNIESDSEMDGQIQCIPRD